MVSSEVSEVIFKEICTEIKKRERRGKGERKEVQKKEWEIYFTYFTNW